MPVFRYFFVLVNVFQLIMLHLTFMCIVCTIHIHVHTLQPPSELLLVHNRYIDGAEIINRNPLSKSESARNQYVCNVHT